MEKHIWHMHLGPYTHQQNSCGSCQGQYKTSYYNASNFYDPQRRYKYVSIRKLVKRPCDTASSRAKDISGAGAFFNNPKRPLSGRSLMSKGSKRIMRSKERERLKEMDLLKQSIN